MRKFILQPMRSVERAERDREILGGLANDKKYPRIWAMRELERSYQQLLAAINWHHAELRKHIIRLDEQMALSEDAVELARIMRRMQEPRSDAKRLFGYLVSQGTTSPSVLPSIAQIKKVYPKQQTETRHLRAVSK